VKLRHGSRPRPRCAICGSTEGLQKHHVGTGGGVIWVCERCHNREHRRFKVISPNRKAFIRQARASGFDLNVLREELSIYGPLTKPGSGKDLIS